MGNFYSQWGARGRPTEYKAYKIKPSMWWFPIVWYDVFEETWADLGVAIPAKVRSSRLAHKVRHGVAKVIVKTQEM